MSMLIVKTTGERISQDELIRRNPNVSFPAILTDDVLASFGCATVNTTAMPTAKIGEQVREVTPVLNADGTYSQAWEVVPMTFVDTQTTDENGATVIKTAAEAEAEFIAMQKSALSAKADAIAKKMRDTLVANVSPAEMASWSIKRAEAIAYNASKAVADAPSLSAEATARGVGLDDLVAKVLAKAQQLSLLEAQISGVQGKHNDMIALITTMTGLQAYDVDAGWTTV
jgi:hypothetical protein